jgi:dTDP-glucose 4,6-dehydratase
LNDICIITEERLGQDSKYWLDSSKIESQLGWKQKINWDEGLDEMADWGRRYEHILIKMKPDYVMRG